MVQRRDRLSHQQRRPAAVSWQVFSLVPFEVGIFAAALGGVIAFLLVCGLPRLHHPCSTFPASNAPPRTVFSCSPTASDDDEAVRDLRSVLEHAGAVVVTEVRRP